MIFDWSVPPLVAILALLFLPIGLTHAAGGNAKRVAIMVLITVLLLAFQVYSALS